jgi:hypothetical protein
MSESVRVLIRPMVFVASTLLGGLAFAAPVAQIVPYAGNLDRDGVPLDGTARLRFRLYTDANAPRAAEEDPCTGAAQPTCVWQEVHGNVPVHTGAFSVRLGRPVAGDPTDIAPILRLGEQVQLEIAVFDDASQRFVTLGRQEIHPVPQAIFTVQPDIAVSTLTATHVDTDSMSAGHIETGTLTAAQVDAAQVAAQGLTTGAAAVNGTLTMGAGQDISFGGERPFAGITIGPELPLVRGGNIFLAPADGRHVCFLSRSVVYDVGGGASQECRVFVVAGNHRLFVSGPGNVDTTCAARCISW